ncbi:cytokinin riboside 5'-monophosphate phosphoribohydrolase [Capsulimonas corticalis]|uniref:Cytokinin riboside 5'-monophosphate phosphoribohydrolase n=1 Tax=Capsulimonas corticalis TaxID=2219043 RepID=A0A402CYR3_9BACT|nr:LOG family protein [Capsulimonas corticalis]BDI31274.1 cytokinin riboside 5'-monophosphate phosphoribohydrolase [Capsulimonas corticalis]
METDHKVISIFGGAQCPPDSLEYRQAAEAGRLLAEAGYTVATGGYQGAMVAASQAAFEAGGSVIGVTMSKLTSPINNYITETRPTHDFFGRLQGLIEGSAGFIAVRGGVGTLVEVTLVWNCLTMHVATPRPLVLVGRDVWEPWLDACTQTLAVGAQHLHHLTVVDTALEAVEAVLPMGAIRLAA